MSAVEWSDAEREAVGNAMDPYAVGVLTQEETENGILDALAPFVAAREAQAAARASESRDWWADACRAAWAERDRLAETLRARTEALDRARWKPRDRLEGGDRP